MVKKTHYPVQGFHPDHSAVAPDYLFTDRQADAGAAVPALGVQPLKNLATKQQIQCHTRGATQMPCK
jgi:hypothetical protein